jgi:hypothetical protein
MGQHPAFIQQAFSQQGEFNNLEKANKYIKKMQKVVYAMTQGYYLPGSLMAGLYENTAYFRIGDNNDFETDEKADTFKNRVIKPGQPVHKVVIKCGGLDYEDPGTVRSRYPADYAIRLIEIVVKK